MKSLIVSEHLIETFGLSRIHQIEKEKYMQLGLALQYGGINTIGVTKTLAPSVI